MASDRGSDAARTALAGLDVDRVRLASRVVTPWWYHPIYAASLATLVFSQTLPGVWPLPVVVGAVVSLAVLRTSYDKKYGISIGKPPGPRTRTLLVAVVAILALSMIAVRVMQHVGASQWWALIPVAITAASALVRGRRYDDALRRELAHDA